MVLNVDGELYPSLVAEALRVAAGVSTYVVKSTGSQSYSFAGFTSILRRNTGVAEIGIGPIHIRTDPSAAMWLYDTGHRHERFIPAWKVLAGDTGDVKNAIVFVGTSAPGLLDLRSTPTGGRHCRTSKIHAQIVEQILTRRSDRAAVVGRRSRVSRPLGPRRRHGAAAAALGRSSAARSSASPAWSRRQDSAGGLSSQIGWLIDPAYPSAGALAVFTTAVLLSFRRSDVERKQRPRDLRPLSRAGDGEAAGGESGAAAAGRRSAQPHHHVLRHPRFHDHLGEDGSRRLSPPCSTIS